MMKEQRINLKEAKNQHEWKGMREGKWGGEFDSSTFYTCTNFS